MKGVEKVFISYAREDIKAARKLYQDLKIHGITPWLDKEDLIAGMKFKTVISDVIQNCSYFLALLSSNSISKEGFVQRELKEAIEVYKMRPSSNISTRYEYRFLTLE